MRNKGKLFRKVSMLFLLLVVIAALGACGKNNTPNTGETEKAEADLGIRYVSFGSGDKTMVVVPGLSTGYVTDNAEAIEAAFADFKDEFTVYLFDVRDEVPEDYTIAQMSEDLVTKIKELGLSDLYMYGCSMGGMQAMYIAGTYPELVERVAIASSACKANECSDAVVGNWIELAKSGDLHALTADMGQLIYSEGVYEANKEAFAAMADALDDAAVTRFINSAGVMPGMDISKEAAAIKCPVLILGSKGDRVLSGAASEEIAAVTGGFLYLYDESYPHAVYDEAPDFRDRVLAFFMDKEYPEGGELSASVIRITTAVTRDTTEDTRDTTTVTLKATTNTLDATSVTRDTKYNAANLTITPEEFAMAGFKLGDSCDVIFDNGFTITDVPFYNGYYVKNGDPVITAYPGFDYISITFNNVGIWDVAGLSEGDGVTIILREAGKYSAVQDSLGQVYSFKREDYDSDVSFCNFRTLTGGNLKENFFFRGTSPVDNSRGRAPYTDGLLKEQGIQLVLDLADTAEDIASYEAKEDFASPYAAGLCDEGKIVLMGMGSAYQSEVYHQKLAAGLKQMIGAEGPVYIHCMEGKDRTGFVCMLLEALAGATYEEMRDDYMITYSNYYSVDPEKTPEKYAAITELYFDAFMCYLHDTDDSQLIREIDYVEDAEKYLLEGGMTEEEIEQLKAYITK